jgi:hypothetical protein
MAVTRRWVRAARRARGGAVLVTRRFLGFLALTAALGLAAPTGVRGGEATPGGAVSPGPPAAGCQVLDPPSRPAPPASDALTVPVIVHYMTVDTDRVDGSRRASANETNEGVLGGAARLEALFAPPRPAAAPGERGVNDVWVGVGIRLHLVRAERCAFDPPEAQDFSLPAPAFNDLGRLRALSARFNTPGFAGINVYQWPKIRGVGGYASAPRADGPFPGPGSVWFHVLSLQQTAPLPSGWRSNVLLMAHEVGHYLTLRHTCTRGAPVIGQPFPPAHPDRNLPPCPFPGSDPHASLMSDRQDGIVLSVCEQKKVRAAARTMLGITTSNPEEVPCLEAEP